MLHLYYEQVISNDFINNYTGREVQYRNGAGRKTFYKYKASICVL